MIKKCCFKNIDKAQKIGRASYICCKCKEDVSLMYFLYQDCISKEYTPNKYPKEMKLNSPNEWYKNKLV